MGGLSHSASSEEVLWGGGVGGSDDTGDLVLLLTGVRLLIGVPPLPAVGGEMVTEVEVNDCDDGGGNCDDACCCCCWLL